MQAELAPGQHLEELVEAAGAAGQGHDGVGVHEHHLLALVHGLGDDHAREVAAALLAGDEVGGDHPEGLAAGRDRRAGDRAHQPDVAGAVDQPEPVGGEPGAERRRPLRHRRGRCPGREPQKTQTDFR